VDNAPDPGPAKKPTPRSTARPAAPRKPPAARKPAVRKTPVKAPAATPPKPPVKGATARVKDATTPVEDAAVAPSEAEAVVEPVSVEPEPEVAAEPEVVEPEVVEPEVVEPEVVESEDLVIEDPTAAEAEPGPDSASEPISEFEPTAAVGSATPAEVSSSGFAARVTSWARRAAATSRPRAETPPSAQKQPGKDVVKGGGTVAKKGSATVLSVRGLTKSFDGKLAVSDVDLDVKVGAFYGIVGPNGAGKTTTLSMITGLLRPDSGTVIVNGADVWTDTVQAKRMMGVLPDRLRLFDRLTGAQLLYYAGVLRGLDNAVVRERTTDLAHAFGLEGSLGRLVSDYSAGMTKKIALAAAMIHSPRLLVLDEPFESVDPVSAATVTEILKKYVSAGGTVVLSSHSMDLVQRICDHVAVVVRGEILADGTMKDVRNGQTLEERFVDLAGGPTAVEGLEWLHSFSD
jgi:ABC-type multidrug transport system ATPase subunit